MAHLARHRGQLGPLDSPEDFGRYKLVERIGVGGMAEVFRATTSWAAGVEKAVCIKRILPPLTSDQRMREMFIQEARIAAELTHANIVPVYEFGIIDEYYFLSMELVDGYTVRDIMMQAARVKRWLELPLVLHLATEVLEGLDYAHRRHDADGNPLSIVHRDITPGNVMASRAGEVKLLDFGIALIVEEEDERRPGGAKGKPGYMAPEQAVGMAVDGRADIFGIGVVLWEMLCHKRLFREKSAAERLRRSAPVSPPSSINPEVPTELDAIVLRALESKPAQRYESAAQFRDALQDYMHAEGLRAGRSTVASALATLFDVAEEAAPVGRSWKMDIRDLSGRSLDSLEQVRPPRGRRVTRTSRGIASLGDRDHREDVFAVTRRLPLAITLLVAALVLVAGGALAYILLVD
ncbi:MAG: hypothetical protein CSA24_00400 [Deltaproteobacteria bacterium]|nr:MAG: hypothetical protein CSB49_03000 [Pseudomonadota bacterium]PIE66356.1 MAG: hypothetical protein CSA24_00400 [Deltaproteobacteria bacterium]